MRAGIVFSLTMIGNLIFSGQYLGSKYTRSLNRNYVRVEMQFLSSEGDTITFNRRLLLDLHRDSNMEVAVFFLYLLLM